MAAVSRSGMAVLVISTHVGLFGGTAWWLSGLSRRMFRMPGDVGSERSVSSSPFALFFYAGLAGFTIPTQRAVLMMVSSPASLGWVADRTLARTVGGAKQPAAHQCARHSRQQSLDERCGYGITVGDGNTLARSASHGDHLGRTAIAVRNDAGAGAPEFVLVR